MQNLKEHLSCLAKDGYTVMPSLLSRSECDRYKSLLEESYTKYAHLYKHAFAGDEGSLANKRSEKVVFNLHNKHLAWFKLFDHPSISPILREMLSKGSYRDSEPYYLYNISARCPHQQGGFQQLHTDSNLPGVNYCLVLNVIFAFDEFNESNGATRVVPGSHKWRSFPTDGEVHPDEIQLCAPQGSAILFDGNLWHGGARNQTAMSRWALLLGYSRWFIKPTFDFMKCTPKPVFESMSERQKHLLGFFCTPPKDEFTRLRRRTEIAQEPEDYMLPEQCPK